MTHRTFIQPLFVCGIFVCGILLGGWSSAGAQNVGSYDITSRPLPFGIGEIPTEVLQAAYDSTIRLVQAEEASNEVSQPSDFGASGNTGSSFQNEQSSGRAPLDLSSLTGLRDAALPTSESNAVNTPAQVQAIQEITQRVDTGVASTAPVEVVPASTFALSSQQDVAETIAQNATAPTVKTQRRSPIAMDPRIRGYRGGQIYTSLDGAYLTPVRPDLDAILSKVDQSLIGSTQIISGPYGLRYGSGFSFINVDTIPTPRYENGGENHLRLGTNIRPNGGQTFNTATLMGGGDAGGYYANVSYRKGSDYEAGNGQDIPSSYDAFNLFSAYGRDLTDNLKMETKFTLVDQGQTEYATQFFDVDQLNHYGLSHSFIYGNEQTGIGFRVDGWYANTTFNGDTDLPGKRRDDFPVLNRVDFALREATGTVDLNARFRGDVFGETQLAGFRAGLTSDPGDGFSWGAGTDLRYVQQEITERFDITEFVLANGLFETGLPVSDIIDPGLYIEATKELSSFWTVAAGVRAAFATTSIDADTIRANSNFRDNTGEIDIELDTYDTLISYYLNNDVQLSDHWDVRVGMGYAERLPDLTDRYSDGLFLAVIQSGFSRVNGDPSLDKERNYQVDARLDFGYENIRGRLSGFHSWIEDYNTYAANEIADPTGARLLQAINTDLATLAGFESYVEADVLESLQAFGSLSYVDGRDREINQPLAGIFPLEGRLGMRLTDTSPETRWGFEWGWRIVNDQDRLASFRAVNDALPPVSLETRTPGFATSYLRGYLRPNDRWSFTGGIENMFDRNYYEHLNLRLPAQDVANPDGDFAQTIVLSPGITPYFGVEVQY